MFLSSFLAKNSDKLKRHLPSLMFGFTDAVGGDYAPSEVDAVSLTDVDADEAPPLEDRMYEAEYPGEKEEGMVEERSAGVEQVENRCHSN